MYPYMRMCEIQKIMSRKKRILNFVVSICQTTPQSPTIGIRIPHPSRIGLRCKGKKYILLAISLLYTKARPFQVGNSRVKTEAKAYL